METIPAKRAKRYVDNPDFLRMLARMVAAAGRRIGTSDEEELSALVQLEHLVDKAILDAVKGMRAAGVTWDAIGTATGTTRQGAQQRWGDRIKKGA